MWKKNLIITVTVAGLIILGSGGLSYWIFDAYKQAQTDEESYKNQISLAKVKRDKVPALEKAVIMLRENVKEWVKILPDEDKVNEFVDRLSDFAEASGVSFTKLQDSAQRRRGRVKEVFDRTTFNLEIQGNVFQFLKFVSLVENYERFIRISDITVKAGDYDEETIKVDVNHKITLLVETFVYHGNEGVAGATKIQNYEKKRDLMIDEIKSARNEIEIERFDWVYDPMIRDPFVDPRSWASGTKSVEGLDIVKQEAFIDEMMSTITDVKTLLETVKNSNSMPLLRRMELQQQVGEKIIELNKRMSESIEQRWISDPACRRKWENEIIPEINFLNKESKGFTQTVSVVSLEELEDIRDELLNLYDSGDYDACIRRYNVVKSQLPESLEDALVVDKEKNTVLYQIQRLNRKAEIAKEFHSKELIISGIICQPERSVIIINGKVLTEGQQLENNLVVERIESKEVYFKFKGEVFKIRP